MNDQENIIQKCSEVINILIEVLWRSILTKLRDTEISTLTSSY